MRIWSFNFCRVQSKAMLDKQATEYKAARVYKHLTNIRFSDFDVVMFTIEGFTGGNNSQFYMALFGPSSERFRFIDVIEVGAHGWRYVDFNSVISSNNNIEIDTREYQGTDSHCCPSKNGKVRFVLTDQDRLIEVEKINVGENR